MLNIVRISKYSFIKLQYIFRAGDYGLRKLAVLNVSNENLVVLKWQNMHVISYIKFNAICSKTCPTCPTCYFAFNIGAFRTLTNV